MKTSPQTLRRNASLLRRDTASGARRATFRLVTPAVDRHGTVILPEGVDITAHKAAGSPFLWMHESGGGFGAAPPPDVVIGKVVEYAQSAAALDITVEFADDGPQGLASRCWEKVQAGLLRMVSIGCSVIASETRKVNGQDVMVFTRSELWEASLVIIGSNREALRLDRAAALRALNALEKTPMDKAALIKLLGIAEDADRETAEAALVKYLCETDASADDRKAAAAALDEHFPESASGEDETRSESEDKDELEAMRAANAELQRALAAAQAARAAAPPAAKVADDAAKREAALAKDVDQWIAEGKVKREERATWLEKHRAGKAAKVVRHLPAGAWTTSQRLATAPGAKVDPPAAPSKAPGKEQAPSLVQRFADQQRAEHGLPSKN